MTDHDLTIQTLSNQHFQTLKLNLIVVRYSLILFVDVVLDNQKKNPTFDNKLGQNLLTTTHKVLQIGLS